MSIAELDALRAAYVDAEEWMLEGVCASLDALRGDRASVRETLVSFLGALPTEEAVDALADLWAPRGIDGARGDTSGTSTTSASTSATRAGGGSREKGGGSSDGASSAAAAARASSKSRDRAPARETRAVRFVEKKSSAKSSVASDAREIRPGDELAPGDLAKSYVNCLECGKIFDLRAKDGVLSQVALEFLEQSARCTHCGAYVEVTLVDGVTRFRGGGGEHVAVSTSAASDGDVFERLGKISLGTADVPDDAEAAAIAAKDRLVHFDKTSAKRTTVIDDQSEWFEIDGNAWLDEAEREELKRQAREMAEAEAEAKRKARTTWTLDLVGRRVVAPSSSDADADASSRASDDRASDDALAAAKAIRAALATNEELAQGGGGATAAAVETARELERRVFVDPRATLRPSFLAAASPKPARARADADADAFRRASASSTRVLDDSPFDAVLAELGFVADA